MGIATTRALVFTLSVVFALLAAGCEGPLDDCNPHKEYDDDLSGAVYERGTTLNSSSISEIRIYYFDVYLGLPCVKKRKFMHHMQTVKDQNEITELLMAINIANSVDCDIMPNPPFNKSLGMEFVASDGRKTFITINFYNKILCEAPFPQKKQAYNKWSFCNQILYQLLAKRGLLAALPGYGEFIAAQKQKP